MVVQHRRLLLVTNLGPLDPYVGSFGEHVVGASMLGPFQRGLPAPFVTVTRFRDTITVAVCASDDVDERGVAALADDWRGALEAT